MDPNALTHRLVLIATATIAIILIVFALDSAQGLLAPVLAAVVLGVVLAPFADGLERLKIPSAMSALLIMATFLAIACMIFIIIEPTISEAIRNAPVIWQELRTLFDTVRGAVDGVQEIQETVTEALGDGDETAGEAAAVPIPNVMDALSYGPSVLGGILIFVGTLYFFLATRHDVYARLSRFVPILTESLLRQAEARVSRYFLAISIVNACFGAIVMVAMSILGMPQPVMWGMAAFLLNFLLYLGPAIVASSLLLVGVIVFDGAMSVAPMAIYILFNMIEAQFVTPTFVGRHMALNPLMVFLSLVFWLWLWGPIGGLVAIPLLVWARFILSKGNDTDVPEPTHHDDA